MAAPKGHPAYNKGRECGRPMKFTIEEIEGFAVEFLDWLDDENNFWMKNFCLEKRINPDCMHEWCELSENFRSAYLLAKHKQEAKTYIGGLIGKFNSNIVKLSLTNHHGWAERSETKISGDKENPLSCLLTSISGQTKELINDDAHGTSEE